MLCFVVLCLYGLEGLGLTFRAEGLGFMRLKNCSIVIP